MLFGVLCIDSWVQRIWVSVQTDQQLAAFSELFITGLSVCFLFFYFFIAAPVFSFKPTWIGVSLGSFVLLMCCFEKLRLFGLRQRFVIDNLEFSVLGLFKVFDGGEVFLAKTIELVVRLCNNE